MAVHIHPDLSNISSDTVVASYPGLNNQGSRRVVIDAAHNILYIPHYGGVEMVDTKGTPYDDSDDTISSPYTPSSSPIAISDQNASSVEYDASTHYLYVATAYDSPNPSGVTVIDTKGTPDPSDDTVVHTYTQSSNPGIVSTCSGYCYVFGMGFDSTNKLLYVGSYTGSQSEIAVINTQTNTLVHRYVPSFNVFQFTFDPTHNRIWLNESGATQVIDTKGTSDPSDDTITTYNSGTNPRVFGGVTTIDSANDYAFSIDTFTPRVNIFSPDFPRFSTNDAGYTSNPIDIPNQPYTKIAWSRTGGAGQTTAIQTQTATATTAYAYDFTNGDTSIVTDHYNWGGAFTTATESNGVLSVTNPAQPTQQYADTWLESNQPTDSFPAGSVVTMRVKLNGPEKPSCDPNCNYFAVFTDDWSDGNFTFRPDTTDHNWHTVAFTADAPFTRIGFEFDWQNTWDNAQNNVQIDSVKIYSPPTWGAWSSSCSTNTGCTIDTSGKALMQYRLTLGTNDATHTATVSDVTLHQGYPSSGTFTSSVLDAEQKVSWTTLTPDQATPTNTSITYSARSGDTPTPDGTWSNWQAVSGTTLAVPDGRYMQYQAVLASTDAAATPSLHGVTIAYLPPATPTSEPSVSTTTVVTTNSPTPASTTSATPTSGPLLTLTSVDGVAVSGSVNSIRLTDGLTTPTFTGKTDAGALVVVKADDKEICRATGKTDGSWTCQPGTPLAAGTLKIAITATSAKGTTALPSFSLIVSTVSATPEAVITATPVAIETQPTYTPVVLPFSAQVSKNVSGDVVFSQLRVSLSNPNGQPLAFVPVTLYSTPQTVTTDKNGIATFRNVLAGDHHIEYKVNKVASTVTPITIAVNEQNGKPSKVTIAVKPSQLEVPIGPAKLHWNIWYLLYLPAMLYAIWLIASEIKSRAR